MVDATNYQGKESLELMDEAVNYQRYLANVDLKGVAGSFTDLYFGGPTIRAGEQDYHHIRQFRLIPTDFGARLVSFHPLSAREITVNLDPRTPLAPDASILAFRYTFGVGMPGWLVR